jgi:hypothetical protein
MESPVSSVRRPEFFPAAPVEGRRPLDFSIAAYVEAHIEQGPILEATQNVIGASPRRSSARATFGYRTIAGERRG